MQEKLSWRYIYKSVYFKLRILFVIDSRLSGGH